MMKHAFNSGALGLRGWSVGAAVFLAASSLALAATAPPLPLTNGDHIVLLGNALADRMQHDGWLETLLVAKFPQHDLVIRNLAVAGDEVATWHRAANFGTRDEWLKKTQADVILAFYGFNESFSGAAGLPKFKADLANWLNETKKQNYSGRGAPRIVLVSPIAAEKLADPNLPDPQPLNANLQQYTAAMAEVALANAVRFVDLFTASQALYQAGQPLTFNGIHLTEAGDKALAPVLFQALVNEAPPAGDFAKLRTAINAKNAVWHSRYRTVDGFNVYGGRSRLSFRSGDKKISNYDVMQEEMSQRDVMTANRDQRVWAVAKGADRAVRDANLPAVEAVEPNKPNVSPYLSGEEAIKHMTVATGCQVTLWASEAQFPELVNPVQMAFDPKGRLWVAAWLNYPERTPTSRVGDSLLVFEDTTGAGKADRCTHFLDDLNCPTGFQFYKDGVLVMQPPDLWFARDTAGTGRADWKERVLMGIDSADTHHTANSLVLDPGGATYLSDGVFHRTQVETAAGVVRNNDGSIYRYEPRAAKFERYAAYGFANPHGRVFDYWGNDLITDATGNANFFGPAISGFVDYPAKHKGIKQFWNRPARPCSGTGLLTSRQFPAEFQGNFLNCNVIGFQGIFRVKVTEDGSGLKGETIEDLVKSDDPNFRPTAVTVGPDGAIYFLDWCNALIGHMQHHLRDPNRDHAHGRIYRITFAGRPLLQPAAIAGQPIPALLELLKEPENDVRTRTKIELGKRDTAQVIAAVSAWTKTLNPKDPAYEHHLLEALWVHQWHNVVNEELLRRLLRSPDYHARAAATRVLCYWRDRVTSPLTLLRAGIKDPHPRVRLEAVRALSFFGDHAAEALAAAVDLLKQPLDYYLQYVMDETMEQLARRGGKGGSKQVMLALAVRKGIDQEQRLQALDELAHLNRSSRAAEVIGVMKKAPELAPGNDLNDVAQPLIEILLSSPVADLQSKRSALESLATGAARDQFRAAAYAALIQADGSGEKVWPLTQKKSTTRLVDLLRGVELIPNANARATLHDKIEPLVQQAPTPAARQAAMHALAFVPGFASRDFTTLAGFIQAGDEHDAAVEALLHVPKSAWPQSLAAALAENLLQFARAIPPAARGADRYKNAVKLAGMLADLLDHAAADHIRKTVAALTPQPVLVRVIPEALLYDRKQFAVQAGRPVEITFVNTCQAPHDLEVLQPDSLAALGAQLDKLKPDPGLLLREHVIESPAILWGTRLLKPGQSATLCFTAPAAGRYPYVCTYPGHWRTMNGTMIVVEDVAAYIQAHPEVEFVQPLEEDESTPHAAHAGH